jgi:hypothetical protein
MRKQDRLPRQIVPTKFYIPPDATRSPQCSVIFVDSSGSIVKSARHLQQSWAIPLGDDVRIA